MEEQHINAFGVRNFKIFNKEQSLNFGKINILTGKNNSGKSSFIDAVKIFYSDFFPYKSLSTKSQNLVDYQEILHDGINEALYFYLPVETTWDFIDCFYFKYDINEKNSGNIQGSVGIRTKRKKCYELDSRFKSLGLLIEWISRKEEGIFNSLFDVSHDQKSITNEVLKLQLSIENIMLERYFKGNSLDGIENDIEDPISELNEDLNNLSLVTEGIIEDRYWTPAFKKNIEKELGSTDLIVKLTDHFKELDKLNKSLQNYLGDIKKSIFTLSSVNVQFERYISNRNEDLFRIIDYAYSRFNTESKMSASRSNNSIDFIKKHFQIFEVGEYFNIVNVENSFYKFLIEKNSKNLLVDSFGSGVKKLIPLILKIAQVIDSREFQSDPDFKWYEYSNSIIILEEPESNLHPDFQSKLADLIVEASTKYNIQFLIETHSEYFIRKLQYLVAKKECKPEDIALYYFTNPESLEEGEEQVRKINFLPDGGLSDSFGKGFYDEATSLKFDLLRLNRTQQN